MNKLDLSLVLACFNEGPTLKDSLKRLTEILDSTKYKWEIIAIDDCSSDDTFKVLKNFSKSRKKFTVYKNVKNIGRGGTVALGIEKSKAEIVGFIDIDLEVSPIYIPDFIRSIENGADISIATRVYKENLSSINRWVLSKGYNLLTRHLLKLNIKDSEAGYKFFKRLKIMTVLKEVKDKKWFFDTEILIIAINMNMKIEEIPVLFLRREDKISTVRIIPDVIDYLKAIYRFKNQ